jgi:1-acyl-sn-glycerol-3-phosphate acyltransferase
MQTPPFSHPKPVTDWWRPDLVALPRLTLTRRIFRVFARGLAKFLIFWNTRSQVSGLENLPKHGPALIVINHLGDADAVLLAASIPYAFEAMAKIEINEDWRAGPMLRSYGVIWVHRGRPDRRALRAALDGLKEGRIIALAPEGRQTLTGGLEEGTEGAAFLAMKSGAPIVPIAITGTENKFIYGRKWFERVPATLTVGKPFFLQKQADRQEMMRDGTRQIMESLARLLPESYRGNFKV